MLTREPAVEERRRRANQCLSLKELQHDSAVLGVGAQESFALPPLALIASELEIPATPASRVISKPPDRRVSVEVKATGGEPSPGIGLGNRSGQL